MKVRLAWITAILVLAADQVSKAWIRDNIPLWGRETVIPNFFNLVHVLNKGAAFGFLNTENATWQPYFFITVTLLATACIIYILHWGPRQDKIFILGLGLILGGALGNVVDRIRFGAVLDFLDIYFQTFHWPAFNIADVAITTGALALLISFYRRKSNVSNPG